MLTQGYFSALHTFKICNYMRQDDKLKFINFPQNLWKFDKDESVSNIKISKELIKLENLLLVVVTFYMTIYQNMYIDRHTVREILVEIQSFIY